MPTMLSVMPKGAKSICLLVLMALAGAPDARSQYREKVPDWMNKPTRATRWIEEVKLSDGRIVDISREVHRLIFDTPLPVKQALGFRDSDGREVTLETCAAPETFDTHEGRYFVVARATFTWCEGILESPRFVAWVLHNGHFQRLAFEDVPRSLVSNLEWRTNDIKASRLAHDKKTPRRYGPMTTELDWKERSWKDVAPPSELREWAAGAVEVVAEVLEDQVFDPPRRVDRATLREEGSADTECTFQRPPRLTREWSTRKDSWYVFAANPSHKAWGDNTTPTCVNQAVWFLRGNRSPGPSRVHLKKYSEAGDAAFRVWFDLPSMPRGYIRAKSIKTVGGYTSLQFWEWVELGSPERDKFDIHRIVTLRFKDPS